MSHLAPPLYPTAAQAEAALSKVTGRSCSLVLTDNRTRLLSVKRFNGGLQVRLQRTFLSAGPLQWHQIHRFCQGEKTDLAQLRRFFSEYGPGQSTAQKKTALHAEGRVYDLAEIAAQINRQYFSNRLTCQIGWGRRTRRRQVRTIRLGSYQPGTGQIRIHPSLDCSSVPDYVIAYVVYHEMLHADLGVVIRRGRRYWHTPEFRRREKLFSHYQAAVEWQKAQFGTD